MSIVKKQEEKRKTQNQLKQEKNKLRKSFILIEVRFIKRIDT